MKKYLQNRNEQLFNKLFESQNIKADLEEVHVVTGEPANEGPSLTDLENLLRGEVESKIRQGASPEQMAQLVKDLDAMIAYKLAGQGYASPLEGVNEIGIPEMTAWQHIEEKHSEHDVEAQDSLRAKLHAALLNVLSRGEISPWIEKIDTDAELTWFVGEFIGAINTIAGNDLNDQEIDRSTFNLRDYIKQLRKEKEKPEEDPQTEAHAIATPDED